MFSNPLDSLLMTSLPGPAMPSWSRSRAVSQCCWLGCAPWCSVSSQMLLLRGVLQVSRDEWNTCWGLLSLKVVEEINLQQAYLFHKKHWKIKINYSRILRPEFISDWDDNSLQYSKDKSSINIWLQLLDIANDMLTFAFSPQNCEVCIMHHITSIILQFLCSWECVFIVFKL